MTSYWIVRKAIRGLRLPSPVLGCLGVPLVIVMFTPTAEAWEADVHYGLTKVLALRAGFTETSAEEVAQANQKVDTDPATDAVSVIVRSVICNRSMAEADQGSMLVQKLHFPATAYIPSLPNERPVKPDSPHSGQDVASAKDLKSLGSALHVYQDSWSHRGESDVPIGKFMQIQPKRVWSHPSNRGGWASHNADLTHIASNTQATRDMAEASFQALKQFLSQEGNEQFGQRTDDSWSTIAQTIALDAFIEASTKMKKLAWFQKNGIHSNESLGVLDAGMSLEQGGPWPKNIRRPQRQDGFSLRLERRSEVPQELYRRIAGFVTDWLSDQRLGQASEAFSSKGLQEQLKGWGWEGNPFDWVMKFLVLWLLEDHGYVNAHGHGLPNTPGYTQLPDSINEARKRTLTVRRPETTLARGFVDALRNCQGFMPNKLTMDYDSAFVVVL